MENTIKKENRALEITFNGSLYNLDPRYTENTEMDLETREVITLINN